MIICSNKAHAFVQRMFPLAYLFGNSICTGEIFLIKMLVEMGGAGSTGTSG